MAWDIHSAQVPAIGSLDEMSAFACETVLEEGFASRGDTILIGAGTPIGVSGTPNMLKVLSV